MTEPTSGERPVGVLAFALCLILVLATAWWYQNDAVTQASDYLRSTATTGDPVTWGDLTFQRAALRDPNTLVVFGSSESLCPCGLPYLAGYYFRTGPTGFAVYAVGTGAMSDLIYAQTLGALGTELTGKKIILSTPWEWFLSPDGMPPDAYAHLYRPEMAETFIFDSPVPVTIKQTLARRMLTYPDTLADDPVLHLALAELTTASPVGVAVYDALDPIGRVQSYVRRVQDAAETESFIRDDFWYQRNSPLYSRTTNWYLLLVDGTKHALDQVSNNPFGWWRVYEAQDGQDESNLEALGRYCATLGDPTPPAPPNDLTVSILESPNWGDLDSVLRITRYFGANALALTYPMPGHYFDFSLTMPPDERTAYFDAFQAVGSSNGVPTITLPEFNDDRLFLAEPLSHISPRGAVLIDLAFDMFWHGKPTTQIKPSIDELAASVPTSPFPSPSPWYCH